MKLIMRNVALALVALASLSACGDKDAEKKIAALEARLSELEGKKSPAASPAVQAQPVEEVKPEGPVAAINFEKIEHDFGTIAEGQKVSYTYKFKNTGDAPLIIQSAQPSCGCTVPEWSKDPIPVGGEGYVKAEFDSKGKPNAQNKTITVTANTFPKQTTLRFKAMVIPTVTAPVQ
jgi:Protein of unknown function (DUF1573)